MTTHWTPRDKLYSDYEQLLDNSSITIETNEWIAIDVHSWNFYEKNTEWENERAS